MYLVDASIFLYAGERFHGESRCDQDGQPCGALLGLIDSLARVCERGASRIVCAFDGPRDQLERRHRYPPYKAHRPAVPEHMVAQRVRAQQVVRQLGLAGLSSPAFEADDIIATLARQSRDSAIAVVIVSADRDLLQLLEPGDEFWNLSADQRLSYSAACKKLRLKPHQLPSLLALCGDAADNVPAVPGMTRHLATRLLRRWGDVETLYANLDAVARSRLPHASTLAEALRTHREQVDVSLSLTQLGSVPGVDVALVGTVAPQAERFALYRSLGVDGDSVNRLEERIAA